MGLRSGRAFGSGFTGLGGLGVEIQHFSDLAKARLALKALNVLSNPQALKT